MPTTDTPPEEILRAQVLGVSEVAAFLGVKVPTVHTWTFRDHLPPPDYASVNGHRAWRRLTIVRWAAKTGRLPLWLQDEGAPYVPEGGYRRTRAPRATAAAS